MCDDNQRVSAYRVPMEAVRSFLKRRRIGALWLIAAAMLMKVIVPAGYMPVATRGAIAIELCSGFGPEAMAMPGMGDRHGKRDHHGHDPMPCGFAGHAPASMAGVDPVLLAIAIAVIATSMFRRPIPAPVRRTDHLRPHLRGPPAIH